jgi:mannose-1-phosphate guanylyltransferase
VDYAVMEPASRDPRIRVAAVPMPLKWIDVGSWASFAETCPQDENRNALGTGRIMLLDTRGTLVASSDPRHLVATIGCDDLVIIHTPTATLVCRKDRAEAIKELYQKISAQYGDEYV